MAMMSVQRDAIVFDRMVTVRFADPGFHDHNGEWQEQTRDPLIWAARADLVVDVLPTERGAVEVGSAVYLIRWLDVSFTRVATASRPAIVGLHDDSGYRNVIGVENVTGYRGRYLQIQCAGTK